MHVFHLNFKTSFVNVGLAYLVKKIVLVILLSFAVAISFRSCVEFLPDYAWISSKKYPFLNLKLPAILYMYKAETKKRNIPS